jgi:hypothetical protein
VTTTAAKAAAPAARSESQPSRKRAVRDIAKKTANAIAARIHPRNVFLPRPRFFVAFFIEAHDLALTTIPTDVSERLPDSIAVVHGDLLEGARDVGQVPPQSLRAFFAAAVAHVARRPRP